MARCDLLDNFVSFFSLNCVATVWLSHRTDRQHSSNTCPTLPLTPLCSHKYSYFLDSSLSLTLALFQAAFQTFPRSSMKPSTGVPALTPQRSLFPLCIRVSSKVASIPQSTVGQGGITGLQFCVVQSKIDAVTGEVLAQGVPHLWATAPAPSWDTLTTVHCSWHVMFLYLY